MSRKTLIIFTGLLVLVVLVTLVAFGLKFSRGKKSTPNVNQVSPFSQQSATTTETVVGETFVAPQTDPETVPTTTDYQLTFTDLYGKAVAGTSKVSVNDNSFETEYTVSIEGIAPAPTGTKYEVWLQTDQGARTSLGELSVNDGKIGTMKVKGGRPEANWFLIVVFKDEQKGTEDLVYRGYLVPEGE